MCDRAPALIMVVESTLPLDNVRFFALPSATAGLGLTLPLPLVELWGLMLASTTGGGTEDEEEALVEPGSTFADLRGRRFAAELGWVAEVEALARKD